MRKSRKSTRSAVLATALGIVAAATLVQDRWGPIASAQAQSGDENKKKEQHRAPPESRPQPPPRAPRATPPPPERPAQQFQRQLPPPERPVQKFQPLHEKPAQQVQPPAGGPSYPPKAVGTPPPAEFKKEGIKRLPPPGGPGPGQLQGQGAPPKGPPPGFQNAPGPVAKPAGPAGPATVGPATPRPPVSGQGFAPKRFEEVQKGRQVHVEEGGRRKVIEEPGNRFIVKEANRAIIRHDEAERFLRRPGAKSERHPDGSVETFYARADGVRIVTVVDGHGRLLRRFRRDRDGREHNIIDNRRFYRNVAIGVGIGALGIVALNLAAPRVTIPYDRYIVDYDRASDDDLYETLDAPPIEDLDRAYSLEEIRYNYELRARVRSIDLDTITFDSGAWEVSPDQYDKLERMARAILRVLRDNPDAVFLIEGHTDKVGSDEDNLSLSDRRAQAVAEILSETFGVPPENLVTQGYGEQYPKVNTLGAEPRNRRVSVRNVTGLMAER
jgi:outer membrane protein OmpA-like peptidoglycan-associated protein